MQLFDAADDTVNDVCAPLERLRCQPLDEADSGIKAAHNRVLNRRDLLRHGIFYAVPDGGNCRLDAVPDICDCRKNCVQDTADKSADSVPNTAHHRINAIQNSGNVCADAVPNAGNHRPDRIPDEGYY